MAHPSLQIFPKGLRGYTAGGLGKDLRNTFGGPQMWLSLLIGRGRKQSDVS